MSTSTKGPLVQNTAPDKAKSRGLGAAVGLLAVSIPTALIIGSFTAPEQVDENARWASQNAAALSDFDEVLVSVSSSKLPLAESCTELSRGATRLEGVDAPGGSLADPWENMVNAASNASVACLSAANSGNQTGSLLTAFAQISSLRENYSTLRSMIEQG